MFKKDMKMRDRSIPFFGIIRYRFYPMFFSPIKFYFDSIFINNI